jgi:hypothetical protein
MSHPTSPDFFLPGLTVTDAVGSYWLRQAMWRLRREIAWLWYERGWHGQDTPPGTVPPLTDKLVTALDLTRFAEQKQVFFETDVAASFLTQLIHEPPPETADAAPGSFSALARRVVCWQLVKMMLSAASLP